MFPNSDTRFGFSSNQTSFLTLSRLDSIRYAIYSLLFPHTKGTVLLVRFQCVDTLVFASKHAEGESTENIRVFGGLLRARAFFWKKNDGDRGVFPVFGKTLFCVETVRVGGF